MVKVFISPTCLYIFSPVPGLSYSAGRAKKMPSPKFIDEPEPEKGYSWPIVVAAKNTTVSALRIMTLNLLALGLVLAAVPALAAGVTITGVNLERKGEVLLLTVSMTARTEPKVFSIDTKGPSPRVVLDFQGAKAVRLPTKIEPENRELAKSVRIGRHPNKVRMVIDLYPRKTYVVEQFYAAEEKQYMLRLSIDDNR
jgi:hypothetical protein